MTNGDTEVEETSTNVSNGGDSLVQPRSPRKVSIAANIFSRCVSKLPSDDASGTTPPKSDISSALFRRRSTFKGLAQSITNAIAIRRMTKSSIDVPQKPKIKMENTYKLCPDDGKIFCPARVGRAVAGVLEANLNEVTYRPKTAGSLTQNLTDIIKFRVKLLKFDRYKIIVNVMLGQCADQGLEASSRCVWNEATDNYCCMTYKNKSIFAIVTVYGLYFE